MRHEKFIEHTLEGYIATWGTIVFKCSPRAASFTIRDTFRKLSFPPLSRERAQAFLHVRRLTRMMFTDSRSSRKVLILPRILPKDASEEESPFKDREPRHCTANLQKRFRFSSSRRGIHTTKCSSHSRWMQRETFRGKLEIAEWQERRASLHKSARASHVGRENFLTSRKQ